jgi:hypothetical protein
MIGGVLELRLQSASCADPHVRKPRYRIDLNVRSRRNLVVRARAGDRPLSTTEPTARGSSASAILPSVHRVLGRLWDRVHNRLAGGGRWIRTPGPAHRKQGHFGPGLWALPRRLVNTKRPNSALGYRPPGAGNDHHATEVGQEREVLYSWHPWAGCIVRVHETVEKVDGTVLRCSREGGSTERWLELPVWMFDRARCQPMRIARDADNTIMIRVRRQHDVAAKSP